MGEQPSLNFETISLYEIGITVTDRGGLSDETVVSVFVTDVNEMPSGAKDRVSPGCVYGCADLTRTVPEGSPKSFQVGNDVAGVYTAQPVPGDGLDNVERE